MTIRMTLILYPTTQKPMTLFYVTKKSSSNIFQKRPRYSGKFRKTSKLNLLPPMVIELCSDTYNCNQDQHNSLFQNDIPPLVDPI